MFLSVFVISLVLVFAAYTALILNSDGKHVPWLRDIQFYKQQMLKEKEGNRLVVLSGSNSMFGVNSDLLGQLTGREVVNLSSHADIDITYYLYLIKKYGKKGDLFVMPLEFAYYRREDFSKFFVWQMLYWGGRDFVMNADLLDGFKFFTSIPPSTVFSNMLLDDAPYGEENQKDVYDRVQDYLVKNGSEWRGYYSSSLNLAGDILVNKPSETGLVKVYAEGADYSWGGDLSGHFSSTMRKIYQYAESEGIRVVLTWPAMLRNKAFHFGLSESRKSLTQLGDKLELNGTPVHCNAGNFLYGVDFFFNDQYHLNAMGANLHTKKLAECLSRIEANTVEPVSDPRVANALIVAEERLLINRVLKTSDGYSVRREHLFNLLAALDRYHADNGQYPLSKDWDGVNSAWGKASEEWINGLAPKYIAELPKDPGVPKEGRGYLYKSDGVDYKLLAHYPEDCALVEKHFPRSIDPMRNCWAYGYWTEGGKNW